MPLELKPPFALPGVNVPDRFLEKVQKSETCWLWVGATDPNGYGRFWLENQMRLAHRISFQLYKGTVPESLHVLHICNNPSCVNPDHLKLGTHKQNMQDLAEAGTNSLQKINYPEAQQFRAKGWTFQQIANHYDCSKTAVFAGFKRHGY